MVEAVAPEGWRRDTGEAKGTERRDKFGGQLIEGVVGGVLKDGGMEEDRPPYT